MEENINVIVDSIKVVILDFIKEHWEPSQKHLLEVLEKNKGLERTNLSLSDEVQKHRHFSDLLSEKVKALEDEMRSMTNVSMMRSWEKKVAVKEQELSLLQQKYEKLERSMKTIMDVNTMLNTRLEVSVDAAALPLSQEPPFVMEEILSPGKACTTQEPSNIAEPEEPFVSEITSKIAKDEPQLPALACETHTQQMVKKKIKGVYYLMDTVNGSIYSINDDGGPSQEAIGKKMEKGYRFFSLS